MQAFNAKFNLFLSLIKNASTLFSVIKRIGTEEMENGSNLLSACAGLFTPLKVYLVFIYNL